MLANEFKARLTILGVTQDQIASELGVSVRTIKRWLNETIIPKIAVLALERIEHKDGL